MKVFVVKLGHNALMHSPDKIKGAPVNILYVGHSKRTVTQVDLMIQQLDRMKYTM